MTTIVTTTTTSEVKNVSKLKWKVTRSELLYFHSVMTSYLIPEHMIRVLLAIFLVSCLFPCLCEAPGLGKSVQELLQVNVSDIGAQLRRGVASCC